MKITWQDVSKLNVYQPLHHLRNSMSTCMYANVTTYTIIAAVRILLFLYGKGIQWV